MCGAPFYEVISLETNDEKLPVIDFAGLKTVCSMFVASEKQAVLVVTSFRDPFAGIFSEITAREISLTAVEYVIAAMKCGQRYKTQPFRHEFQKRVILNGNQINAQQGKLFKLFDLGDLLRERSFRGTKAIQFVA